MLIVIAVVKLLLTNICIDSGLKGGHFFPVIYCGVCIGCAMSLILGLDIGFCTAVVTAALVGTYKDGAYTRRFYQIKDLDAALYIADNELGVWYAGDAAPDPKALTVTDALVCEQAAFSRELFRFSAGEDDARLGELKALWFEGEAAELPATTVLKKRMIKLKLAELANLFYCIDVGIFEEGAFLYNKLEGRAVSLPKELADELFKE